MKKHFESENLLVKFDAERRILFSHWNTAEYMSNDEYKTVFMQFVECVKQCKPLSVLVDARKAFYVMSPETQEWINNKIIPVYESCGTSKLGVLTSTDFIMQLSLEQVMEDSEDQGMQTHFFDDEIEAVKWLETKGETIQSKSTLS